MASSITLLAAVALIRLQGSGRSSYSSAEFHYTLEVPSRWNIDINGPIPVLFNFKRSEGGPQGLFPDHGAEISLIPLAGVQVVVSAGTMDEWIGKNLGSDHSAVSIKRLPAGRTDESTPRDVVEVEADFQRAPEEDLQHETNYYFALRGALFRLRMLYWKDDSRAAGHRLACLSVLHSIHAAK